MTDKKEEKKQQPPPNDVGKIKVSEMIRIIDAETKEVIVEKKS